MLLNRFAAPSGLSDLQANFVEFRQREVRRIPLPRTRVNRPVVGNSAQGKLNSIHLPVEEEESAPVRLLAFALARRPAL
jgi:hypothetical protein